MIFENTIGTIPREPEAITSETGLEVAVIGMACRFPGAQNIDEFWENLKNGVESVITLSQEEHIAAGVDRDILGNPGYISTGGILEGIEYFDAGFFGYTPLEANVMNPQIRIFHECTWEAIENSGYAPDNYNGLIGLFAGYTPSLMWDTGNSLRKVNFSEHFAAHTLNSNYFCTLISYKLNLKGPAVTVQTACSTSLVAIHTACRSLLTGQCDMALAGGVTIAVPPKMGDIYEEGMINSPDGHCRTFDVRARGTVSGDGVGIVTLKLLTDAVEDNDHIYAVIKGSAINNDGNRKVGYTAPSVEGQQEVIKAVFEMSELDPETITYVETHGTGTTLGDPIEIEALKLAFNSEKKGYCRIGSVKTNVGHLNSAAGIAGFIKTVLALVHKQIPPSLHFETPNPKIDFENSPFVVNTQLTEWKTNGFPRRAGVSSFGIGGTNAHTILEAWSEEAAPLPVKKKQAAGHENQLILLSARTAEALDRMTENLKDFFEKNLANPGNPKNPGLDLANTAYTLQVGRKHFEHRRTFVCSTIAEAAQLLRSEGEKRFTKKEDKHVIFLFPGQGAQYLDMGLELYKTEPVFQEEMDRCFEILESVMGYDLKEILYPDSQTPSADINATEITQPLIFIFEYAMARLLIYWGIQPHAMMGHSIGEYTAACLAGVFSLEDALRTVVIRGKLMQQMPTGSMLSVPLSEKELEPLLDCHPELCLAAVNSASACVVSGPHETIETAAGQLKESGVEIKRLHTSHAFHSYMMEPILKTFEQHLVGLRMNKPKIPFISNLTGTWITTEEAVSPLYWTRHLRETVRFFDGLTELMTDAASIFVETGPGRVLTIFATQHPDRKPHQGTINLVRHPKEQISDRQYLLNKVGRLWLYGVAIDWGAFHGNSSGHRIPLPTYPFARQAYSVGIDLSKMKNDLLSSMLREEKKSGISAWLYTTLWQQSLLPPQTIETASRSEIWLVFNDHSQNSLGIRLTERLEQAGHTIVTVETGPGFQEKNKDSFMVNPGVDSDYKILFSRLTELNRWPHHILHLWNTTRPHHEPLNLEALDQFQDLGFYSLMAIAQAIGKCNIKKDIDITVVAGNMFCVTGDETIYPERTTLLGALRVIPKEFPNLRCRSVDVLAPAAGSPEEKRLVKQLAAEVLAPFTDNNSEPLAAYRGNYRWVPSIKPIPSTNIKCLDHRLKEKGVYLVTGGLGGIGMTLAGDLAHRFNARLILIGRSLFPEPGEWDRWITEKGEQDPVSRKILEIRKWEASGAEVMTAVADVSDFQQMDQVITRAVNRFGNINGIIHSAGVPDFAGVILRRTRETTGPILAPKVKGTMVLNHLLHKANPEKHLDFLVLCSSLSSVLAPFGQVGYTAANAFLDSYASYKMSPNGMYTVSVNWDTWEQVGMAVEAVERLAASGSGLMAGLPPAAPAPRPLKPDVPPDRLIPHPMFHHWEVKGEKIKTYHYVSFISAEKDWVLDEHRLTGIPTLPGTAYLEMVRAALDYHTGMSHRSIEIRNISFISPLMAAEGEEKEIHTILEEKDGGYTFTICEPLPPQPGKNNSWRKEYARGSAMVLEAKSSEESPGVLDIQAIEAACSMKEQRLEDEGDGVQPVGLVTSGPRWNNGNQAKFGEHQALARLELPEAFTSDLQDFRLHPAMLDTATSLLLGTTSGGNNYLPLSYQRIAIHRSLPDKIIVYARNRNPDKPAVNTLAFDITLTDDQGAVLVEIEAYTVIKVTKEKQVAIQSQAGGMDAKAQELFENASTPEEGVEVFHRILSSDYPQVLVSTTELTQRLRQQQELSTASIQEKDWTPGNLTPASPRPELSTPYTAPENQNQQIVADIWQEILGVESIGINDDFFELGGDSLKAITITTRIQKKLQVEVPLAEFFSDPSISGLCQYIVSARESRHSSILPQEQKEYYPLSSPQKRLFILNQINPGSVFYNVPRILEIEGTLQVERLDRAYDVFIQRHESLRTSFRMLGTESIQVVHPPEEVEFRVEYRNISADGEQEVKMEVEEIIKPFIRPFDLTRAPLMRVVIVTLESNKYLWMMDFHHIVTDASSMRIMEKELITLYRGEELSKIRLQYKDFSEWQNKLLLSDEIRKQEEYWLKQLEGDIPQLNLPTDFERPPVHNFEGGGVPFEINREETGALNRLAAKEGVTMYMLLLAVYNVFLSKLSNQEDILVGTTIAGRRHADWEPVFGMFVNTLCLRNYPKGEQTFNAFLKIVKKQIVESFANQDYQFEDLVEKLALKRVTGRNPLFDVSFSFRDETQFGTISQLDIPGLQLKPYEDEVNTSHFDLTLRSVEIEEKLFFSFYYSTVLFKKETIEMFTVYFRKIVSSVIENPKQRICDMKIISGSKEQGLLSSLYDDLENE